MEAGNAGIDLAVDNGNSDDAVQITPNAVTPLSINVTNVGTKDCYVFIKLVIPELSGHPILSISLTGNWQMVEDGLYQYTADGISRALESGMTTPEFVAEARFYDFEELVDFTGEVEIIAYAVQTDGFNSDASASDIWSTTIQAVGNYCISLGSVNLGDKHEGDKYSCQVEIEFKDVAATSDDGSFWLRAQGNQDGRWYTGNVWNDNVISLHEVPADGVYKFTSTAEISETMPDVLNFQIAFRCDNWGSGLFRVRNVKVEKGNTCSEWSQGI